MASFEMARQGIREHFSAAPSVVTTRVPQKIYFMVDRIKNTNFETPFHKRITTAYKQYKTFIVTTVQRDSFFSALKCTIDLTLEKRHRCLVVIPFHEYAAMLHESLSKAYATFPDIKILHVTQHGSASLNVAHILLCTPEQFCNLIVVKEVLTNIGTIIWANPHAYSKSRVSYLMGMKTRAEWIHKLHDRRQILLCSLPKVPTFAIGLLTCNDDSDDPENHGIAHISLHDPNYSQKVSESTIPVIKDTDEFYLTEIFLRAANYFDIEDLLSKALKMDSDNVIIFARKRYVKWLKVGFAGETKLRILGTSAVWLNHSADMVFIDYHPFIDDNTLFRAWLCAKKCLVILFNSFEHGFLPNPTLKFLSEYPPEYGITLQSEKQEVLEYLLQRGVITPGKYFFKTLLVALFHTQRTFNQLYEALSTALLWDTTAPPPRAKVTLRKFVNGLCASNLLRQVGGYYTTAEEGFDALGIHEGKDLDLIYSFIFEKDKNGKDLSFDPENSVLLEDDVMIQPEGQEKFSSFEEMKAAEKKRMETKLMERGIPSSQFSKLVAKSSVSDPTRPKSFALKKLLQQIKHRKASVEKDKHKEMETEERHYKRTRGAPTPLTPETKALIEKMVCEGVSHPSEIASKTSIPRSTVKAYLERRVSAGEFIRVKIKGKRGRPPIHYTLPLDDETQVRELCGNCAHYTRQRYCILAFHLHRYQESPYFLKDREKPFSKKNPACPEFASVFGIRIIKGFRVTIEHGRPVYHCPHCDDPINIYAHPIKCSHCGSRCTQLNNTEGYYKVFLDRKDALRISFRKYAGVDLDDAKRTKINLRIKKEHNIDLKETFFIIDNNEIDLYTIKRVYAKKGVLDDEDIECLWQHHIFVHEVETSSGGNSQKRRHTKRQQPTSQQQEAVIRARSVLIQPLSLARVLNEIIVTQHLNALILREHTTTSPFSAGDSSTSTERNHAALTTVIIREKKQWDEVYRILQTKDVDFLYYYRLAEARAAKEKWDAFRDVIILYYPWLDRVGARLVLEQLGEPYEYSRAYSEIHADINYLHKHITFATQELLDCLNLPSQGLTGILHTSDFVYDVGDSFKTHIQLFLAKNILLERMKQEYHNSYYGRWDALVYTLNHTGVNILNQFVKEFWEQQVYFNGKSMSMQEAHELWAKKALYAIKQCESIDPLELVITYSQEEFELLKEQFLLFKRYVAYINS